MNHEPENTNLLEREPQLQPLWRNLIVLKSGRSLFGYHFFLSKEDAEAAIPEAERMIRDWLRNGIDKRIVADLNRPTETHLYSASEYSHAYPVIWNEAGE